MILFFIFLFFTFSTAIAAGRVLPGKKKDFWDRHRAHDGEREVTAQSNLHTALVVEEFVHHHSQFKAATGSVLGCLCLPNELSSDLGTDPHTSVNPRREGHTQRGTPAASIMTDHVSHHAALFFFYHDGAMGPARSPLRALFIP